MSPNISLRSAVGVLATTTIAAQAINAGLILVQSRFYTPVAVGVLANVLSVATILVPLCTMQLPLAIPQQSSPRHVAEIVGLTLFFLFSMLIVLAIGGGLYFLFAVRPKEVVEIAVYGLCLVPFLALYDLGRMLAARDGAFRSVGAQNVVLASSRAAIQIIGGLLGGAQIWLVLGESVGRLTSYTAVRRNALAVWHAAQQGGLASREALKANWRFPVISLPSTFLDNLGGFLPPILIGNLYGMGAAGLFFLAQRLVSFPILLLIQSTADVIQVRAAQIVRTDKSALPGFVLRAAIGFFVIGLGVAAVLLVFVLFFWSWVFSAKWATAREMAMALIFSGITQTVCAPLTRILIVTNRQAHKLLFDVSNVLAALIPVLAWFAGYHPTVTEAVWSIAAGYAVAYVIYAGVIFQAAKRPIEITRAPTIPIPPIEGETV